MFEAHSLDVSSHWLNSVLLKSEIRDFVAERAKTTALGARSCDSVWQAVCVSVQQLCTSLTTDGVWVEDSISSLTKAPRQFLCFPCSRSTFVSFFACFVCSSCPLLSNEQTLSVLKNGQGPVAAFRIQMFKFVGGSYANVFLHCNVQICHSTAGLCQPVSEPCNSHSSHCKSDASSDK